jgi:hypothetical protein
VPPAECVEIADCQNACTLINMTHKKQWLLKTETPWFVYRTACRRRCPQMAWRERPGRRQMHDEQGGH